MRMDLHTAGHRRGVVCAPHHAAAEAGRAVLAEGGNALEAMVAMAATIAAVYPHMNHIGGDGFWLVREPSGRVRALMAAGRAGADARPRALSRLRDDPAARAARGAHRAGRDRRLDRWRSRPRKAHGGALPLDVLLGAGDPPRRATAMSVTRSQARLTADEARRARSTCPASRRPSWSTASRRTPARCSSRRALAATLDQLAHAGLDDFYRGDVGREIAADLERIGSPVTRADLERCRATLRRAAVGRRSTPARSTTRRRRRRASPR